MKAQIALLFRDHTHLLEDYWVFYEQLHSTTQRVSDDEDEEEDEAETYSMPSAQILHSVEEHQRLKKAENQKHQSPIQVLDVSLQNLMKSQTVHFILICSDITILTITCWLHFKGKLCEFSSFCLRVLM